MWSVPLCCLLAACISQRTKAADVAAGPSTTPIPILEFENEGVNHDGSYKWRYATGNEIQAEESGYLANPGVPDQEGQYAQGSYSYTAPDGTKISMTYTAGPNGFVPIGDHIPTPPPIPPLIAKALEFLKTLPANEEDARDQPTNEITEVVSSPPPPPPPSQPKSKPQYRSIYYRQ